MKVSDIDKQRKIRRTASFALLVYDLHTEMPMGQILDMSAKGMKLMIEDPATVGQVYYCRIPLDKKIHRRKEVFFDAECRWCNFSEETGWYKAGFVLRFPSPKDAEVIEDVNRVWMADQTNKINAKYTKGKKKKRGFFRRLFKR